MSNASPMNTPEIIQAITPLIDVFEHFEVDPLLGGPKRGSLSHGGGGKT